jgi:DNA-binding response OmpR family regulator
VAVILVIEDNEAVGRTVQRMLHLTGHDVVLARDCATGLHLWRAREVDLAVVDVGLPDQSGLGAIMEMRALQHALPIIIISGRCQLELLEMIRDAGLTGNIRILSKPFGGEELVDAVEALLLVPPSWGE